VGDTGFISLRFWDGVAAAWYDSLKLPDKARTYVVPYTVVRMGNASHTSAILRVAIFDSTIKVDQYDVCAHTHPHLADHLVEVVSAMRGQYPNIWE
jgi:hypothetical protein